MRISVNKPPPPRVEMLPLIDVVFLLLVFFIFAMLSMAVHRGQPVDLPVSGSVSVSTEEAISITIQTGTTGITIFVDDEMTTLEQLSARLQQRKAEEYGNRDCEVQIFADKSVTYQDLFRVLDCVKQSGLTRISLQAEQGKKTP